LSTKFQPNFSNYVNIRLIRISAEFFYQPAEIKKKIRLRGLITAAIDLVANCRKVKVKVRLYYSAL